MWGDRRKKPLLPTAPIVEKTPEQRAEVDRAHKAYWDECNPLRKYLVTFVDGREKTVTAHSYSVEGMYHTGVTFYIKLYRRVNLSGRDAQVVVSWARTDQVRSVDLVEEPES